MSRLGPRQYDPKEDGSISAVQRIVEQELGWAARDQRKADFGIDLQFEVRDDSKQLNGKLLAVQVKTGKSQLLKTNQPYYRLPIKSSHREYWLQHSLPVIVVLYDSETDTAYWEEVTNQSCVSTDRSCRITVPKSNILDRSSKKALADIAQNLPKPGDIKRMEDAIQRIDKRFQPKIVMSSDAVKTELHAMEEVYITLNFKLTPDVDTRVRKALQRGGKSSFSREEVSIEGSPLFEAILKKCDSITIGPSVQPTFDIHLCLRSESGVPDLIRLCSSYTVEEYDRNIYCNIDKSPLQLRISIHETAPIQLSAGLSWDNERWFNHRIMHLPSFEQTSKVVRTLYENGFVDISIGRNGECFRGRLAIDTNSIRGLQAYMDKLWKARSIASKLNTNPKIPRDLTTQHGIEIEELYSLLFSGSFSTHAKDATFGFSLNLESEVQHLLEQNQEVGKDLIIVPQRPQEMSLLDETVKLPPIRYVLTGMKLKNMKTLRNWLRGARSNPVTANFVSKNCDIIRQLHNPPTPSDSPVLSPMRTQD